MTRARDIADTQDNVGGAVAPYVAGKNALINGGFDIWQRGTSFAYGGSNVATYTADRWFVSSGSNAYTISRVASGLDGFQYAIRVQRNSGSTTTSAINVMYGLETSNSVRFAGKQIIVSFYARAGANFSASSNTIFTPIISGTGTDQNINSGFTGQTTVNNKGQVLTTSWQRFTVTGTVASTATQLAFYLASTPTGTAGANDYYDIAGVQLEEGNVPSPFARSGGSIGGELALCQRYFQKSYDITVVPGTAAANGYVYSSLLSVPNNSAYLSSPIKSMRTAPTVTIYGYNGTAGTVSEITTGVDKAANTGIATTITTEGFIVRNGNATTQTFSQGAIYQYAASAEL
jgi:hypothetical protein